jgi:hypothetical protein
MKNYCVEHIGAHYSITAFDLEHLYDLLCGFVSEEEALDAKRWAETAEIGDHYCGSCYGLEVGEEIL